MRNRTDKNMQTVQNNLLDTQGKVKMQKLDPVTAAAQLRLRIDSINRVIANLEKAQQVTQETLQREVSI